VKSRFVSVYINLYVITVFMILSGCDWYPDERATFLNAVTSDDRATVKRILGNNPKYLNVRSGTGESAIHFACSYVRPTMVEILLSYGASVNDVDASGYKPIHSAIAHIGNDYEGLEDEQIKIIKVLIKNGASVNDVVNGLDREFPLHMAVRLRNRKIVKLLLENGADQNLKDGHGLTPIELAQKMGIEGMCDLLDCK